MTVSDSKFNKIAMDVFQGDTTEQTGVIGKNLGNSPNEQRELAESINHLYGLATDKAIPGGSFSTGHDHDTNGGPRLFREELLELGCTAIPVYYDRLSGAIGGIPVLPIMSFYDNGSGIGQGCYFFDNLNGGVCVRFVNFFGNSLRSKNGVFGGVLATESVFVK